MFCSHIKNLSEVDQTKSTPTIICPLDKLKSIKITLSVKYKKLNQHLLVHFLSCFITISKKEELTAPYEANNSFVGFIYLIVDEN